MVCSCLVPSKHVLLQIIFCSCVIEPCSWEKNDRSLLCVARKWLKYENKFGNRMIKQLLTSVIAKYGDLSVSHRSIICRSWRLRQITVFCSITNNSVLLNHQPQGKWESGPVLKHFLSDLHTCNTTKHVKLLAPQETDLVLFSPNASAP